MLTMSQPRPAYLSGHYRYAPVMQHLAKKGLDAPTPLLKNRSISQVRYLASAYTQ